MEKIFKGFTKHKLIAIMMILCENKRNIERIKTILKTDLEEIA